MVLVRTKNFLPQNKKRTKITRDTMYSAMSGIPSGGPPGGTHTQELWYSLRGIDARLESVLSTDKCLCDACCARSQPLILLFLFSYFGLKNFLYGQAPFCTDVSVFAKILSSFTSTLSFFSRRRFAPEKIQKSDTPLTCNNTHETLYATFCKSSSSWRFPMRIIITSLRKVRRQKRKRNQIHLC